MHAALFKVKLISFLLRVWNSDKIILLNAIVPIFTLVDISYVYGKACSKQTCNVRKEIQSPKRTCLPLFISVNQNPVRRINPFPEVTSKVDRTIRNLSFFKPFEDILSKIKNYKGEKYSQEIRYYTCVSVNQGMCRFNYDLRPLYQTVIS